MDSTKSMGLDDLMDGTPASSYIVSAFPRNTPQVAFHFGPFSTLSEAEAYRNSLSETMDNADEFDFGVEAVRDLRLPQLS